jgi:hypothetical protein
MSMAMVFGQLVGYSLHACAWAAVCELECVRGATCAKSLSITEGLVVTNDSAVLTDADVDTNAGVIRELLVEDSSKVVVPLESGLASFDSSLLGVPLEWVWLSVISSEGDAICGHAAKDGKASGRLQSLRWGRVLVGKRTKSNCERVCSRHG